MREPTAANTRHEEKGQRLLFGSQMQSRGPSSDAVDCMQEAHILLASPAVAPAAPCGCERLC